MMAEFKVKLLGNVSFFDVDFFFFEEITMEIVAMCGEKEEAVVAGNTNEAK